jgi:hypothetical protein
MTARLRLTTCSQQLGQKTGWTVTIIEPHYPMTCPSYEGLKRSVP